MKIRLLKDINFWPEPVSEVEVNRRFLPDEDHMDVWVKFILIACFEFHVIDVGRADLFHDENGVTIQFNNVDNKYYLEFDLEKELEHNWMSEGF